MAWDRIRAAKAQHETTLFARANVVGVAIGHKVIGGRETDEACIVVYVESKRPEFELRRRDIVPKALDGVRTDVVETGRFRAIAMMEPRGLQRTTRIRPAPGGVSVGHERVSAGTLGVLAQRADGSPVLLSNNHIFANSNDARAGDPILQPGPADGGTAVDAIARLDEFVPIVFSDRELGPLGRLVERGFAPLLALFGLGLKRLPSDRTNLVDAAVASPLGSDLASPEILEIGRVVGTTEAEIGMRVQKSGRTTGRTSGRVRALDGVVQVDYDARTAVFRQQIISDLLSRGGDSGSLVVDERRRAVGLLFAGSDRATILNPIHAVLNRLQLRL